MEKKIEGLMGIDFDSKAAYTKIKTYKDSIITIF